MSWLKTMEICKVEFISNTEQKIIIDFSLDELGNLEYKPSFEPKVNPKTNLGLAGKLCEIFITSLINSSDVENTQLDSSKSTKKLES